MRIAPSLVFAALAVSALNVAACGKPEHQNEVPTTCAKVGQTCSLPPGKLGSCVSPMGCTSADCLVCQSQH